MDELQNMLIYQEFATAFLVKTGFDPRKVKMVIQQETKDFKVIQDIWFEPLGLREAELYRQRAEKAEVEVKRLKEERRWIPYDHTIEDGGVKFPCEVLMNEDACATHWRPLLSSQESCEK